MDTLQRSIDQAEAEMAEAQEELREFGSTDHDPASIQRRLDSLRAKQSDRQEDPDKHAERMKRRDAQAAQRKADQAQELARAQACEDFAEDLASGAKNLVTAAERLKRGGSLTPEETKQCADITHAMVTHCDAEVSAEAQDPKAEALAHMEALNLALSLDGSKTARAIQKLALRETLNGRRHERDIRAKLSREELAYLDQRIVSGPAASEEAVHMAGAINTSRR